MKYAILETNQDPRIR